MPQLKITITNRIIMEARLSEQAVIRDIKERLQFSNPEYWIRKQRKRSTYGVPEVIQGWQHVNQELRLPRGFTSELLSMLDEAGVECQVIDRTRRLPEVDFNFTGSLRGDYQEDAVADLLSRRFGTIASPTGSGKTVMGLYVLAKRRQPTCVVVHTGKLVRQWTERAVKFLGLEPEEIGYVTEGQVNIGNRLTIALVQTLHKHVRVVAPNIGHLLMDECHHAPASSFAKTIAGFDCTFTTGLSATHKRRDSMEPLIYWFLGPLVHEVGLGSLVRAGHVLAVEPIVRNTDFMSAIEYDGEVPWAALVSELTKDRSRNMLIANDILIELRERGGPVMVLSDRVDHCERLAGFLDGRARVLVAHGSKSRKMQETATAALESREIDVLVATGQLLGEGFDAASPNALFLTCPIAFGGRLEQYIGRICRPEPGKQQPRVYDYHDVNVGPLMAAAGKRMKTYKRLAQQARGR